MRVTAGSFLLAQLLLAWLFVLGVLTHDLEDALAIDFLFQATDRLFDCFVFPDRYC